HRRPRDGRGAEEGLLVAPDLHLPGARHAVDVGPDRRLRPPCSGAEQRRGAKCNPPRTAHSELPQPPEGGCRTATMGRSYSVSERAGAASKWWEVPAAHGCHSPKRSG